MPSGIVNAKRHVDGIAQILLAHRLGEEFDRAGLHRLHATTLTTGELWLGVRHEGHRVWAKLARGRKPGGHCCGRRHP